MQTHCRWLLLLCLSPLVAHAAPRITYDRQCLTIDGRDTFVYSGAFHYFRCPKELWRDRFATMKRAGLNTVETYVAWNWHEREMPASLDDTSKLDMTDLVDWLRMATDEFGFNVIVRPGPYICAEWDGGGYPHWLLTKRPADFGDGRMWLRSNDKVHVDWCKHWMDAVARTVKPFLITNRPVGKTGIILYQIENEYDYANQPGDVKIGLIEALAHMSRDAGIDVPLTTCVTSRPNFAADPFIKDNVLETRNTYPRYDLNGMRSHFTALERYQPDKFRMITELQGGWFSGVGGELSEQQGFTPMQIQHVTLYAIERGFTSLNYYMFFGGTNFGDRAARGITTTYDYDAPVREPGTVTARYDAVHAIGEMLKEHGERLTRSELVECDITKTHDDVSVVARRARDGSLYVFVSTEQRTGPRKGEIRLSPKQGDQLKALIPYDLPPFGAAVVYLPREHVAMSEALPKPVAPPARPWGKDLPRPVALRDVLVRDEPPPTEFRPVTTGQTLEDFGVMDCRYVMYRVTPPARANGGAGDDVLSAEVANGDGAAAVRDGQLLKAVQGKRTVRFALTSASSTTASSVDVLYENAGHPHGGGDIEQLKGVRGVRLAPAKSAAHEIGNWRMQGVTQVENVREVEPDFDDSKWRPVAVDESEGRMRRADSIAVYRAGFDITDAEIAAGPWRLAFGRIDDEGWVYLNGKLIGHATDWSREQTIDVGQQLKPGHNVVAVVVKNVDGPGGLAQGVNLETAASAGQPIENVQLATELVGDHEQWWKPGLDESAWQKAPSSATRPANDASPAPAPSSATAPSNAPALSNAPLRRWYRVHFKVPALPKGVWAPWRVTLAATGNGFLYINGHLLGRYWQAGPQRDFYVPECWLNAGDGAADNVLTISLRATDQPPVLRAAELSLYRDQAEFR